MGSKVMLNDKGRHKIAKEDEGKVFEVRSNIFEIFGTQCVLLKGKTGGYAVSELIEVEEEKEEIMMSELGELEQYRAIGTAEECREAMDRQRAKKPVEYEDKINPKDVVMGNSEFAKDIKKAMQDLIDSQPTVYDVDKVVEQLEMRRSLLEVARISKSAKAAADTAYSFAIGDIRKGGINENR